MRVGKARESALSFGIKTPVFGSGFCPGWLPNFTNLNLSLFVFFNPSNGNNNPILANIIPGPGDIMLKKSTYNSHYHGVYDVMGEGEKYDNRIVWKSENQQSKGRVKPFFGNQHDIFRVMPY